MRRRLLDLLTILSLLLVVAVAAGWVRSRAWQGLFYLGEAGGQSFEIETCGGRSS